MTTLKTGEIIKTLRKNKKITQEQLAEVFDISAAAISKWESGQTLPDIQLFPVLARYFRVSIDFLMGFSSQISDDEKKGIYEDVAYSFTGKTFEEARTVMTFYINQYPLDYTLRFEIAMIGSMNISKITSEIVMKSFVLQLIAVFNDCTNSNDLAIKQSAYYQMGNLYIAIEEYDLALKTLEHIPTQEINPSLLYNMILLNKQDYLIAGTSIRKSISRAVNELLGELGHLVSMYRVKDENKSLIEVLELEKQFIVALKLNGGIAISTYLMLAQALVQSNQNNKALDELQNLIEYLEQLETSSSLLYSSNDNVLTPFTEFKVDKSFLPMYQHLLHSGFDDFLENERFEKMKTKINEYLMNNLQ